MRRKKPKSQIEVTCSYCGCKTETFVSTPDYLRFCRHQYVGFPPIKDCMTDYYKEQKNVRNEQIQKKSENKRWLQSNSKEQPEEIKKEKKEIRLKNLKRLEDYQKELKLKQWQKRKENHL